MEYKNDLNEIISLIQSWNKSDCKTDVEAQFCLQKITYPINDDYLLARARCVQEAWTSDRTFRESITSLSHICNKNDCKCEACPINKYCNSFIANAQQSVKSSSPKIVDLFCGAGGLSLGFIQEGYIISLANDIEPCCVDTYSHNHPETPRKHIVLGDIKEVIANIKNLLRYSEIDVVVGGPPCQGFSMANRQRLIDDPRNHLYKSYIDVLKIVQPKFFVMENVKGMLSVADQVKEDFEAIGYTVSARILNAKNFGVPQNRERLIFIGNKLGYDNDSILDQIEAYGIKQTQTLLIDALYGLQPLQANRSKNSTSDENDESGRTIAQNLSTSNKYINTINQNRNTPFVFNHKARYNNDRDIEIYSRLNPGDKSDDPKIADIMPYARRNDIFKDKYFKLEPDKVCKTITAHMKFDCNMYIHPTQARGLTPREAARVQSYPDDYFFRGSYTKTYMQIGNSVPPMLGRAIAHVIKKLVK